MEPCINSISSSSNEKIAKTPPCIDLRPICEKNRWKWNWDESLRSEHMSPSNTEAPWHVEIPCLLGTIYPFSDELLVVSTEGHSRTALKLLAMSNDVRAAQGNIVLSFPPALLSSVAKIVKPRKKRPGNPEGVAALARYRELQAGSHAKESAEDKNTPPGYRPPGYAEDAANE